MAELLLSNWWILVLVFIIFSGLVTVNQGTIAVGAHITF